MSVGLGVVGLGMSICISHAARVCERTDVQAGQAGRPHCLLRVPYTVSQPHGKRPAAPLACRYNLFCRNIPSIQILLCGDESHLELYAAKVCVGGGLGVLSKRGGAPFHLGAG